MTSKTINALQKLYVENGGNIANVQNINTIPDMILKLSTLDISASQTANILSNSEENEEVDENIMNSLKNLYDSYGGNSENLTNIDSYADMIMEIGNAKQIYNELDVGLMFSDYNDQVYGKIVGQLQDYPLFSCSKGIRVVDNNNSQRIEIIDNSAIFYADHFYEIEGGLTESGKLSGTGYFIALNIFNTCNADNVYIGITPSETYTTLDEVTFVNDETYPYYNDLILKVDNFSNQKVIIKVVKDNITRIFYLYYIKNVSV